MSNEMAEQWLPMWEKIFSGSPRYVNDLTDAQKETYYKPLPRPIPAYTTDAHGNVREPDRVDMYPNGPWEMRDTLEDTPEGKAWVTYWVHLDVIKRSRMRRFQRRAGSDSNGN